MYGKILFQIKFFCIKQPYNLNLMYIKIVENDMLNLNIKQYFKFIG